MSRLLIISIVSFCFTSCVDFNPEKYKTKLEDYAKYMTAFDEARSHGAILHQGNGQRSIPRYGQRRSREPAPVPRAANGYVQRRGDCYRSGGTRPGTLDFTVTVKGVKPATITGPVK